MTKETEVTVEEMTMHEVAVQIANESTFSLAAHEGQNVTIVLADTSAFEGKETAPKADPDQKELEMDDEAEKALDEALSDEEETEEALV